MLKTKFKLVCLDNIYFILMINILQTILNAAIFKKKLNFSPSLLPNRKIFYYLISLSKILFALKYLLMVMSDGGERYSKTIKELQSKTINMKDRKAFF